MSCPSIGTERVIHRLISLDGGLFDDLEHLIRIRTAATVCAVKAGFQENYVVIERRYFDDLCLTLQGADRVELERRLGVAANQ